MKHIPNILSSLRIVLVVVFVWLFKTALSGDLSFWWPIAVYAIAFFTDILDGWLARTFHWVTPVGKILDPFADKLMAVTALVCILVGKSVMQSNFAIYLVLFLLIAAKEILMVIGGTIMLRKHRVAFADWTGKVATGLMTAGVVLSLLSFPVPAIEPWNLFVLSAAVLMGYYSMVHYARTQMFSAPSGKETTEDERELFDRVDKLHGVSHACAQNEEQITK